jgi:type II secretory pathway pseudopilin PulG
LAVLQWEQLVTHGHVRAARWRKAAPFLFWGAVAAIILGVFLALSLPDSPPSTRVAEAKSAYADAQRRAVSQYMQESGARLGQPPQRVVQAPTPVAAQAAVTAALEELGRTGRLPEAVARQTPDAFWRGDWRAEGIHAVEDGRSILLGYFVDVANPSYGEQPQVRRIFSLLRRDDEGAWRLYCLAVAGANPCGSPSIDPTAIPATMRGLLPAAAFEVE